MKKTIKISAAFLMLIATLGSCVKGDKGDAGVAGANGTNGANGNANVAAGTITVSQSNWTWNSSAKFYFCDVIDSAITSDIVSNGSVLAFVQAQGETGWEGMPTNVVISSTVSINYGYYYSLYDVRLQLGFSSQAQASSIATNNYKIVCITSNQRMAHPNTNWNDYNSIKATLDSQLIEATIQVH